MYDEQMFFVADPINRYSMSMRTNPQLGQTDGWSSTSRTKAPALTRKPTGYPRPRASSSLMLRLYWPDENDPSILDGSWVIPPVRKTLRLDGERRAIGLRGPPSRADLEGRRAIRSSQPRAMALDRHACGDSRRRRTIQTDFRRLTPPRPPSRARSSGPARASAPPRRRSSLAARIVLDLVALDLGDAEIMRFGVGEIDAAHRGSRPHGVAFGELHAGRGSASRSRNRVAFSVWSGCAG